MCDALRLSRSELGTGWGFLGGRNWGVPGCSALFFQGPPAFPPSPPKNLLWAAAATYAVCSAVLRRNYVGPSAHLSCLLQRPYSTNHTRGLRCIRSALRYSVLAAAG